MNKDYENDFRIEKNNMEYCDGVFDEYNDFDMDLNELEMEDLFDEDDDFD